MSTIDAVALVALLALVLLTYAGSFRPKVETLRQRLTEEDGFQVAESLAIAAFGVLIVLAAYQAFGPQVRRLIRTIFSQIA